LLPPPPPPPPPPLPARFLTEAFYKDSHIARNCFNAASAALAEAIAGPPLKLPLAKEIALSSLVNGLPLPALPFVNNYSVY